MLEYEGIAEWSSMMTSLAETSVAPPPKPSDVTVIADGRTVEVRARAGRVNPGLAVAFVLSLIWTAKWLVDLGAAIERMRQGNAANPGPELFVTAVMGLAGIYCAGLMLWIMLGSERLAVGGGRLRRGNLWLFGVMTHKHPLGAVGAFETASKDCGTEADGCCCSVSTVDYTLFFRHNGRRISVFTHLSRPTKDWLRDRLNAALAQARDSGS
jgi:hypothetical protein